MERAYELQQILLSFSDTLGKENAAFQRIKSTRYRPFIQGRRMFLRGGNRVVSLQSRGSMDVVLSRLISR